MRLYKIIAAVMICMMTAVGLAGCTTFDNFKEAFLEKSKSKDVTIQIGIFEPMSGADRKAAEAEIAGIELANEVYQNADGKIVELLYSDNSSDISAAETAITDLISKKPDIILGSYGSVYSMVAGSYINDAQIPAIAITNSNPLVTKNYNYYFRVCYVDSNQGDLLARYVLEYKKESVAGVMLPDGDDAAMATTTAFIDRIEAETENDDAIIAYEKYKPGEKDFSEQLESIRNSGVKSVLLPGDVNDSVNIMKQAESMGLDVVFLGDADWATKEFKNHVKKDVSKEHMAFVNFFDKSEAVNEESETFLKAYKEKYGSDKEPNDSVALGYDAYVIALDAISKAGDNATGEEIRKVLAGAHEFKGASGNITFNTSGDPIRTAYISTWDGSKMTSIYTVNPN